MVSGLTFRSLIHVESIVAKGEKQGSIFNLLHVDVQFSKGSFLKRLSFLYCVLLLPSLHIP